RLRALADRLQTTGEHRIPEFPSWFAEKLSYHCSGLERQRKGPADVLLPALLRRAPLQLLVGIVGQSLPGDPYRTRTHVGGNALPSPCVQLLALQGGVGTEHCHRNLAPSRMVQTKDHGFTHAGMAQELRFYLGREDGVAALLDQLFL